MPRDGSPAITPVVRWRSDDDEKFFRNIKTGHIDPDVRVWHCTSSVNFSFSSFLAHHCGGVQSKDLEDVEDADNKSFVSAKESDKEMRGEEAGISEVDFKEVETMPCARKPAMKKLLPPKLGTPKKAATINELTSSVGRMMVLSYSPYGFDAKQPFKIWKFTDISSFKIVVQFITPPLPEHIFKVEVSPEEEKILFTCVVP